MKLLIRWAISSLALFVAAWLVPGISVDGGGWFIYAIMAIILGLVNAIVRPILKLLTCPLILLTLGLFVLVINGITLWLASVIATNWFSVGFYVDGFWSALLGAAIVSVVTVVLSALVREENNDRKHREQARKRVRIEYK
jgi:putative membrane protein